MDEQVGLRFMLVGGAHVMRLMSLGQAIEAIDKWKAVKLNGTPQLLSEKNGVRSFGVDLSCVMFMDVMTADQVRSSMQQPQPPQMPAPSFGR